MCLTLGFFALIGVLSFSVLGVNTVWACPLPVITLTGSPTMNLTVGGTFVDPGATATGAYTGTSTIPEDLTSKIVVSGTVDTTTAGTYTLTYTITVVSCNSSVSRQVIVAAPVAPANTPPVITILGANPLTIDVNTTFTDPGATASDAEDGNLTPKIIASGTVITTAIGTYTVTYTVTDSGALTTTATRTVNVVAASDGGSVTPCTLSAADFHAAQANGQIITNNIVINSSGTTASVTLTNHTGCSAPISLASFKMFVDKGGTNWLSTQQRFDATSLTDVPASSTQTLSVNLPTCKAQIDSYYGEAPVTLLDSNPYQYPNVPFNLVWAFGQGALCQATPPVVTGVPTITLIGANPFYVTIGTTFTDPGATATDTKDGNITSLITKTGTVNTTIVGTSTLTYSVTDSSGASTSTTRTVVVEPASVPPPSCSTATTTLFSGTLDQTGGHNAVAVTYHNPAWTASIPGAIWIWSVDPVANPLVNETSTFTRTFSLSGTVTSGALDMAADNSFSVSLNGHALAADPGEFNYTTTKHYVVDPAWFVVGTNTLTFTVTNFGLAASTYQTNPAGLLYELSIGPCGVTPPPVINGVPTITLLGANPFYVTVGTTFTDPGATATDTKDGNITPSIIVTGTVATTTIGTSTLTYTVTDSSHVSTSTTRTVVTVASTTPVVNQFPTITLIGANPLELTIGNAFTDPGATAADSVNGVITDISGLLVATGTVDTATIGTYTITYTVKDSGGITATSTRVVDVNAVTVVTPAVDNGGGGGGGGVGAGPNIGTGGGYGTPLFASSFGGGTVNPAGVQLSCPLLNDYLRYGYSNNPVEVVKLQAFLQRTEGYDVDVNGNFDLKTLAGVNAFQTKYLGQVMGPWGATQSSGYVYITTKKMINQIACDTAFVISPAEQTIIDAYKTAEAGNGQNVITPGTATSSPGIGFNAAGALNVASAASVLSGQNSAAVVNSSISGRLWAFIKGLFGFN